jgi:Sec-independent protein translocase protein TatA
LVGRKSPEETTGFSDRVTRLEARVDAVNRDLRALAPLVRENGELRTEIRHLTEDVRELRTGVTEAIREFRGGLDALEERLIREAKERQKVREQREERERKDRAEVARERQERVAAKKRDRWQRWAIAGGLWGTFVTTVAVLITTLT